MCISIREQKAESVIEVITQRTLDREISDDTIVVTRGFMEQYIQTDTVCRPRSNFIVGYPRIEMVRRTQREREPLRREPSRFFLRLGRKRSGKPAQNNEYAHTAFQTMPSLAKYPKNGRFRHAGCGEMIQRIPFLRAEVEDLGRFEPSVRNRESANRISEVDN
jgi:hypothetical protein